jgi:2-oxoglutarate dehydrogenase E2 component (dihydrolipoamide succinyltransferase)
MSEIQVPRLAESISEAVLAEWLRPEGATVRVDEPIATLETDKAAVEIAAAAAGVLHHAVEAGETVTVGQTIARIEPGAAAAGGAQPGAGASAKAASPASAASAAAGTAATATRAPAASVAPAAPSPAKAPATASAPVAAKAPANATEAPLSPAVRKLVVERGLDPAGITPSGRGGRLLKEDVIRHIESVPDEAGTAAPATNAATPGARPAEPRPEVSAGVEEERIVPMSRIRQRIAERLVQAQHTAAILTTFNEIDMSATLELRARHKDAFEKRHGVKLGFMSLFGRAVIAALEEIPELNAEIRGTDIVYRRNVNLGVAVGTPRGLVVPVVRHADALDFAGLEREIARLAGRAREGTVTLDELVGGTFTISNGGVYGSLLSTPILNPPQSGILGMHKIEKRPIAVDDQVVIRPMMYVALSYDHRLVDGEQAVTFLVRVKERLEDPERMLLSI